MIILHLHFAQFILQPDKVPGIIVNPYLTKKIMKFWPDLKQDIKKQ